MPQLEFTLVDGSIKRSPETGEDPLPDLIDEITDGRRAWTELLNQEWLNLAHVTTFCVRPTQSPTLKNVR
jgi:hypothetical protein